MNMTVVLNNDSTSVAFNCMAYGATSYVWERENGSLPSTAEGVNNSTLLLHNILPSYNGQYRCVAGNQYGTTNSSFAVLSIEGIAMGLMDIQGL